MNYLELLGVREDSSPEEIVDAVRKQIAGLDIEFLGKDLASDQARRIGVAAETLIGPDRGRYFSSDIYAGKSGGYEFMGAAQFALPSAPGDTYVSGASIGLMGASASNPTANDAWTVDLLPASFDANWPASATWNTISGATADRTLSPPLTGATAVTSNSLDSWSFGSDDLASLANRYAGAGKLSIRVKGNNASNSTYVYWYGGGTWTETNKPALNVTFTPNPQFDHLPIARAGLDQTVTANTQVTLNGSTTYDYEGAITGYQWTAHASNPATVTLSSATVASPTFTPAVAGTYRFSLVATDSASQSSTADEVMVTVLRTAAPSLTKYTYNGDGDRVKQEKDSVVTEYLQNSVPKNEQVLMETTGSATTYYVYGHDLLYTIEGTTPHYLHTDSLGSTIAVTDANGDVEQAFAYDIFGQLRKATGSGATTYTFTGEENDHDGFVYLRARYYEPATGRFTSRDPFPMDATDTQTNNRYVYVKNNPTNYVDPSGEFSWAAAAQALCGPLCMAPIKIYQTVQIRREMRARFPGDNDRDAYRHAETSRRIASEVDPVTSFVAGYAHEASNLVRGQQNWASFRMDVYNNTVGLISGVTGQPVDMDFLRVLTQDRKRLEYIRSQQ